jgi:DNA-binding transcriptional ArsR family regulator
MNIYSYIDLKDGGAGPMGEGLDEDTAAYLAELFRALSDTSRVRIVSALVESEMNVSALAQAVGISESAVSHHLRSLRQMRLVRGRKEGVLQPGRRPYRSPVHIGAGSCAAWLSLTLPMASSGCRL